MAESGIVVYVTIEGLNNEDSNAIYKMSSHDKRKLGISIRTLRICRGFNQTELSALIGVTQPTMSRWESGVDTPSIDNINFMTQLFNCTYSELMCASEPIEGEYIAMRQIYSQLSDEQKAVLLSIAKIMLTERA